MLPVNEPKLDGDEKELLLQCIESGWVSSDGPFVKEFEDKFAGYLGSVHGISVVNGTAALETALYAIGVKKHDEVILPSFTIISCAIAVIRLGAIPVFVDVEPDTWCINALEIEEAITPRTKAIMVVHMYGHPVDMDPVLKIAEKYSLLVVEDSAQVHGAEYKGKKCGGIADISTFSFYANKIITTGEGGMVVTANDAYAERARSYRNLCFIEGKRFYHEDLGYNFRMTNLQAAVGLAQLKRLEEFVDIKRKFGKLYAEKLGKIDGLQVQIEKPWAKMVYWMYCIVIDESLCMTAEQMMNKLKERDIGTRPFFRGLHSQPVLQKLGYVPNNEKNYPVTERISKQGLYLPSGLTLTEENLEYVVNAVYGILN